MLTNLVIVFIMTSIIHTAETLSYAVRFAGVRLNKIAVALSLTGIIVLVSRTANMVQGPIAAKFVDYARAHASFDMLHYLRVTLLASSVGTLAAIMLFPTCVNLFGRLIAKLEVAGSIPKLVSSVTIGQLKNTKHYIRLPRFRISRFRYLGISKTFILINVIVTSFYTVGVLAALYAAHLFPALSTTASQASGIINGVATILLTIFIDPQLGLITDKALNNTEYRTQLGKIYVLLMTTRFLGTMLAQLVLVPAALLIGYFVKMI
ncbi:lipid II flippase Amj family protein [Paenibacillus sp. R14(2021)]|uniref:lipid II flippase Amj family protein n=1 Tax=Paenibacillus sp. R14(2021) TaxID=2859228 RepID=UPI001C615D79|nr:lipid II flippase Amj family protein [Paenibacillus sp. R14(2021)]